uniref:pentatricopeptide repeat-containing protein At4g21065-like n=1 Tax=Erigeron canadensis TaxID=72917 RepID=UPI001CB90608|nr:pentatricopeptide repeat-containing protein At4g21065-like [Erigeron canadensis]XP_043610145.1 pentatricopeptide repeat-containing protein At4g21065-like [Erigeron canadensis]
MEITTMAQATQLHAQLLKNHPQTHPQLTLTKIFNFTALSPSGNLTYAHQILKSLQTHPSNSYFHNTLIRAYSDSPDPFHSIDFFVNWLMSDDPFGPNPDRFTFPFVLKSCAKLKLKRLGKQVHGLVLKSGLGLDLYVQNGLISFYSGCELIGFARKVFDEMPERDVVSWTAVINGLVENKKAVEGLRVFERMERDGVEPNSVTVVAVLRACAETGALSVGRKLDRLVSGRGGKLKKNVVTGLIDMYSKCGCIYSAVRVFDGAGDRDVYVWTAMISGLASHGQCKEAVELFKKMESVGLKPDEKTMTAVLSACRNMGWVDEGLMHFENIRKVYKLRPTVQHYGCVVDLLARAGRLEDAENFIKSMSIEPDAVLWRSLIWGCKVHGDSERLEHLIKHFEGSSMDACDDCGTYVLLGNVYASNGKWKDKANVRRLMNKKGLVKPSGYSRIEINGVIYEFTAGSTCNTEAENIYKKLDEIEETLRENGYDPKVSDVLLEIDDEEKATQLLHHSEKLAVSFGLIKTEPGTIIRIVKNLRSCEDCHSFMKHISSVYQREILIRDRIRFHHFTNGKCSCGDYW